MKKIAAFVLLAALAPALCPAQTISTRIEKTEFKVNEPVSITFEVRAYVDSVGAFSPPDFYVDGPSKSTSVSTVNGSSVSSSSVSYVLTAKRPGKAVIAPPRLLSGGKTLEGAETMVQVSGEPLSKEDHKRLALAQFRKSIEPEGAGRIVFKGDMGYIELRGKNSWEFHRALTEQELKYLEGLK